MEQSRPVQLSFLAWKPLPLPRQEFFRLFHATAYPLPSHRARAIQEWIDTMASKRTPPKTMGKGKSDANFTEFVNCRLNPDLAEQAAEYSSNRDTLWQGIVTLLETGYKVTVSYQFERGTYTFGMTCRNEESVNNGKTLTAFGGTAEDCIAAGLIKHFVQLDCDWSNAINERTQRFG